MASAAPAALAPAGTSDRPHVDPAAYVSCDPSGLNRLHLMVEGAHCGGCVQKIERALLATDGVESARLNLSTRRLVVAWHGRIAQAADLTARVEALGYTVMPFDPARLSAGDARYERHLLRCMGVAGFAAANVMLLSIAVWAGHAQGMGQATRDLLHWFSALIALPAIAYAGRPFFTSALRALRAGRAGMDLPITVGVILTAAMSLFETVRGGEHAYFDSAIALVFFLLIGRYLDSRARGHARFAAERLLALGAAPVTVLEEGRQRLVPTEQVRAGAMVLVAAGERIGVDGRVVAGTSEIDTSLITGETLPARVGAGDRVFAGTLNVEAPLRLETTAVGESTLLAEIVRLTEVAEQRRGRFVGIADRVARLYAPVVHALALATFLAWTLWVGVAWQQALLYAVAVLIITCPCALGLAVPAVQVIASGRLMRAGVLLKSATALERFAAVDTVVFDKTGTLTEGRPTLRDGERIDADALKVAASLAGASRHPLARALVRAAPGVPVADGVREVPGSGLALATSEGEVRLGRRGWATGSEDPGGDTPEIWLARPGSAPVRFVFDDAPRADAAAVVAELEGRGLGVGILSGDRASVVDSVADRLAIPDRRAEVTPAGKCAHLENLTAGGRKVLMVGDGLNDAAALAAATVSLSPSSAAEISQTAADAVFQGQKLRPVLLVLEIARRADRLVRQNFALAFAYNVVTIPLAVMGLVTPLVAAVCMSASSILVVGNALRLGRGGRG